MATQTKSKSKKATAKKVEKSMLRRSALAYVGLYGLAYDRLQMRREQARVLTSNLFDALAEKGETTWKQSEVMIKQAETVVRKGYSETADKVAEILPVSVKSKVDVLEDELTDLQAKLSRMTKATPVKKTAKKPVAKKATVKKAAPKKKVTTTTKSAPAVKEAVATAKKPVAAPSKVAPAKTAAVKTAPVKTAPVKPVKVEVKAEAQTEMKLDTQAVKTPVVEIARHIPYFNDVKRYDPLANEDVVRKIVNHCGIALRSEDARFVACSDESERVTVRDSWLKKKLGLTIADTELDKKVLDVCGLMQRDQKKNRVTFYYLLAKKERALDTL